MLYPAGRPPAPFATCVARIVKRSGLLRSQPVELDMRRIGTSVEVTAENWNSSLRLYITTTRHLVHCHKVPVISRYSARARGNWLWTSVR